MGTADPGDGETMSDHHSDTNPTDLSRDQPKKKCGARKQYEKQILVGGSLKTPEILDLMVINMGTKNSWLVVLSLPL